MFVIYTFDRLICSIAFVLLGKETVCQVIDEEVVSRVFTALFALIVFLHIFPESVTGCVSSSTLYRCSCIVDLFGAGYYHIFALTWVLWYFYRGFVTFIGPWFVSRTLRLSTWVGGTGVSMPWLGLWPLQCVINLSRAS